MLNRFKKLFEDEQHLHGPDSKTSFTTEEAAALAKQLGYTGDVEEFRRGLDIELEHGTISPATNITNDDTVMTAKITLAHLNEIPDYNTRLLAMEQEAKSDKVPSANVEITSVNSKPVDELTEVSASPDAIKKTYQDMKGKYFSQSDALKATANWYKTNTDYIKKIVTTVNEQNMSFNDVYHTCLNLSKDKKKAIEQALSLWTGGRFDALESEPRKAMIKKALAQIEEMPLEATHGEVAFDTFDKSLYEVELLDTFESKLESALEESRLTTYTAKIASDISTIPGIKRLGAWSIADGTVGLYRLELDGNAYEVVIRPVSLGQYKQLWGNLIKKREDR